MRSLSLANRMFLVAAVALVPTVIILTINLVTLRQQADRKLRDEASDSARIATLEMSRILGGIESVLRAVSSAPVVRSGNVEGCDEYLARVINVTPELSDIAITDAEGNVVCRSSTMQKSVNLADRDYFEMVRAVGGTVTGTYAIGRTSGVPTLPIALQLGNQTVWQDGVIVGGLDLDWLGARLKERNFLNGNALTIADRTGVILAREPLPERFVGTRIPDAFQHLVTAAEPGTLSVVSQDGTKRIIGYVPASDESHGLYLSAGVATDLVYVATNRLMLQGAAVGLLGVAAAFLLARFTSNFFIRRPFARLVATIEAATQSNMETRTNLNADLAEFGRAGRALDDFMDQLSVARSQRQEAERQREVLAKELDHRVKNILATVQAVARQTFRGKGIDEAVQAFAGRLHSMASAHTALMNEGWQSAPLSTLIDETISPFKTSGSHNFQVEGHDLEVTAKAAMGLSMALHELCTNAAKYGALSVAEGEVTIAWTVEGTDDSARFSLVWQERGGPPVQPPTTKGFGSVMIEQILASQLEGSVIVDYPVSGMICSVIAPLRMVAKVSSPDAS